MRGKTNMADSDENVRAIDRAIDVLECFTSKRPSLSIGELEKLAKLSRPTLYRILSTLIGRGFLRRDGDPPRYSLDIGAARLADAWIGSLDIVRLAIPIMKDLLDTFDETIALYLRRENIRLCVAEMPSRQALSFSRGLGHSGTLVRGASGLAILAFLGDEEAAPLIAREYDSVRSRTLRRKLAEIRESGYAISSGDFIAGAQAIASPVFDRRGDAIGSLGLFGPSARFSSKQIQDCAKAVRQCASRLSFLLGYQRG